MEPNKQEAAKFLITQDNIPIADVRTPLEYERGHIPGAYLFPIFSTEERAEIGKLYALNGNEKAIERGYEIAGTKLIQYLKEAIKIAPDRKLSIYCWRGGMRSESLAWLLGFAGFHISTLEGGYKAYRRYCHSILDNDAQIILLGGYTGSGKTRILELLEEKGEQVINLEILSRHKGSAFGWIGEDRQPNQEQFENMLADQWLKFDLSKTIWIEDESINIGKIQIPRQLFNQMERAPIMVINTNRQIRIKRLVRDYQSATKDDLLLVFGRISKRIGLQNCKEAMEAVEKNELNIAAGIALAYYDKAYAAKLANRNKESLYNIRYDENPERMLSTLMKCRNTINLK
jgi:tRNA 2-selenouridine synthase